MPRTIVHCSPEVFRPLSATMPSRATYPGYPFPGHVASSRLPCASTLYSLDGLPGILSTRRAHGVRPPSELDLTEVARASRRSQPLAIDHAGPISMQDSAVAGATSLGRSQRSRFRGYPSTGWDRRAGSSPLFGNPGSPGFRLAGALPFPCSDLLGLVPPTLGSAHQAQPPVPVSDTTPSGPDAFRPSPSTYG